MKMINFEYLLPELAPLPKNGQMTQSGKKH